MSPLTTRQRLEPRPRTNPFHSEDLWQAAVAKLSQAQKINIDFDCSDKLKVMSELLRSTEEAKESSDKKSWRFKRKSGETVIVRDVLGKVAKWVHHFREVGDIVVQYDPGHAALPWAGVRLLLMVGCSILVHLLCITNPL